MFKQSSNTQLLACQLPLLEIREATQVASVSSTSWLLNVSENPWLTGGLSAMLSDGDVLGILQLRLTIAYKRGILMSHHVVRV